MNGCVDGGRDREIYINGRELVGRQTDWKRDRETERQIRYIET